jgi:hypothetical protein
MIIVIVVILVVFVLEAILSKLLRKIDHVTSLRAVDSPGRRPRAGVSEAEGARWWVSVKKA